MVEELEDQLLLQQFAWLGKVNFLVEVESVGCFGVPCLHRNQLAHFRVYFFVAEKEILNLKHVLAVNNEIDEPFWELADLLLLLLIF